jgi:radical SAM protein with 4Fe4S-binding SPASM domain
VRGIRSIRRGHSPNCSATGSFVGAALLSAAAVAAVVNAFADRLAPRRENDGGPEEPVVVRPEADGAILRVADPPALVFVDRSVAQALGVKAVQTPNHALSAPTEVHVSVEDKCPLPCADCYLPTDGGEPVDPRPDLEALAAAGVFEVAIGGGETGISSNTLSLVAMIRGLGMVPNLTTSGLGMTAERAAALAIHVGQVNISLDGVGDDYRSVRGFDGTSMALRAIKHLRDAGIPVGVNTVLTRHNLAALPGLADVLVAHGVSEWQWLRLKPAGKATSRYEDTRLTPEQAMSLWPLALQIEASRGLQLRFDCALVPFIAAHGVPVDHLEKLGVAGCPGGHSLWTRRADGRYAPCSFAPASEVADVVTGWQADETLSKWRRRSANPPAPCSDCAYQEICRGGCRIVAGHVVGDPMAPDPECPRVAAA